MTQICLLPLVIKRQLKSNPDISNYYLEFDKLKVFELSGALTSFPVFIFSFTTQINLLQCFEELEKPTLRRMHKVLAKQHFVCFTIYLFIGVFGYLSFPLDDPNANSFIQRYDPIKHFFVLVVVSLHQAVLLLILVIFVAQPFNSLPTRDSFEYFICGSNKSQSPYWLHLITSMRRHLSPVMHAAVTSMACYCIIKKINMDKIIGYFSSVTSTFVAYIFPFGFFLQTFTKAYTKQGQKQRKFIEILYYGFWVFQILSIISLFLGESE